MTFGDANRIGANGTSGAALWKFHYNYGICLAQTGRLQEALSAFLKARDLKMEEAPLYTALGATYARLGRRTEAREALQKALSLDPGHPEARRMLEALR